MFSSGNVTEKARMARLDCEGQTVVDLYAGIGSTREFRLKETLLPKVDHGVRVLCDALCFTFRNSGSGGGPLRRLPLIVRCAIQVLHAAAAGEGGRAARVRVRVEPRGPGEPAGQPSCEQGGEQVHGAAGGQPYKRRPPGGGG
eukprot:368390-Prorocentrum_minimum.AAC.1